MLKFLEEPNEDIIAILLTTNRYKIIDTILSRCQIISLKDDSYNINLSDCIIDLLKFIVKKDDLFVYHQYIMDNILVDKNIAKEILGEISFKEYEVSNYIKDYLKENITSVTGEIII